MEHLHRDRASFDFAQDEVNPSWQIEFALILSEVEERAMSAPRSLFFYWEALISSRLGRCLAMIADQVGMIDIPLKIVLGDQ